MMRDVSEVDLHVDVFGQRLSMPIFVSPAGELFVFFSVPTKRDKNKINYNNVLELECSYVCMYCCFPFCFVGPRVYAVRQW